MSIIGHIEEGPHATWYLLNDDRLVTVHKAWLDAHPASGRKSRTALFFSDNEHYGSVTAQKLGLNPVFIRNASDEEAESFWANRPEKVKEIIHV